MAESPDTPQPPSRRSRLPIVGAVILIVALVVVYAWTHRSTASSTAATMAAAADSTTSASGSMMLATSDAAREMAGAFDSATLPAAAPLPAGTTEQQAAALAEAVAAGTKDSTAAIVAAVLASGYAVRGDDNQITRTVPADQSQGLALDAWMIAASAKLYGNGYGIGLDRLASALAQGLPALKGADVSALVLAGIRDAAKSDQPQVRFWADFLSELGRRAPDPFDLLDRSSTAAVRLDPVQVLLITSRLAGDFASSSHASSGGGVLLARFDRTSHADPLPCNLSDTEGLILDYTALGMTTGFGQVIEYAKNHGGGEGAGAYGEGAAQATALLTVLKLIASYAALDVKIEMNGNVLVRTKTTAAGDRHKLTATVKMDVGKWQAFNCLRPALNAAGVDFSLPGDGALNNVKVIWDVDEGGGASGLEAAIDTAAHLGDILAGHPPDDPTSLFYLDPPNKSPSMDQADYTDDKGQVSTSVVGMPQATDLSNRALIPHMKRGGVSLKVAVKATRLQSASGTASTIGDMATNVIAGLTGDFLNMAVGTAAETIYRSQWYQSDPFYFDVKDWDTCYLAWTGTITRTITLDKHDDTSGPLKDAAGAVVGQDTTTHVRSARKQITIELQPHGEYADSLARIAVNADAQEHLHSHDVTNISCHLWGDPGTATADTYEDFTFRTGGATSGSLMVSGEDGDVATLSVSARISALNGPAHKYRHGDRVTTCANIPQDHITAEDTHYTQSELLGWSMDVPVDHKHPDELKGSRTETDSDGSVIVTTWKLARCRDNKQK